ncbi:MAG: hypothetical protein ABJB12_23695 [Pseudomonadota bacterium]
MSAPRPSVDRVAAALYGLGSALFGTCAALSYRRHIHVDEVSGLYSIQLVAAFRHANFAAIELCQVLFAPLARCLGASSERLFTGFRWLELAWLLTLCVSLSRAQRAWSSAPGKAAVFFAAVCFGPLWRHGFELRHDMFVAFEVVLLLWALERARERRLTWLAASAAAFGSVLVQANSSKAFVLWVPALFCCALLSVRGERPWLSALFWRVLAFLPGFLAGLALVAGVLGLAGALGDYLAQLTAFTHFSSSPPYRLHALPLLWFAIERAPVHALFVALGLLSVLVKVLRRKDLGGAWGPTIVFGLAGLALAANPTPFPYNLTWLSPAWLAMSAVGASFCFELVRRAPRGKQWALLLAALTAALCLNSFARCEADPYYRKNWDGQLRVIAAAEALTAPDEPVLDLTGLVVSRPPVAKDWVVHSLFMPAYHAGMRETVRHIIRRVWPPVAITVYRWGFLDRADLLELRRNYVPFSSDVWTLGSIVYPSTTELEVHRDGRYTARGAGDLGTLDGQPLRAGDVLLLTRGKHAVASNTSYTLAWLGPAPVSTQSPPGAQPLFENGEFRGQRD